MDDYTKRRYIELQKEYDFLTEQLEYLRNSEKIATLPPSESFKLKRQLAELESKRESVQEELEALDKSTNSEQLYRTLLKLGYEKQVEAFVRSIQKQKVSAFLIHGAENYGQRWLLNRLVDQYVPDSISGKKIRIDLGSAVQRKDIQSLWRQLGRRVGGCTSLSPLEITEKVYHCWKTENVLLVFDCVHLMPPDHLDKLIQEFWKPLTQKARNSRDSQYQLLLFLVDHEGTVGSLDHLFCEQVDVDQSETPVRPPSISKFTSENVSYWMLAEFNELPQRLTHNIDEAVQDILAESDQGIPEYVLAGIFERCGYDYYDEVKRLWKL